ncbi:MAG TPA: glycosyltransferase family 2 protein [Actinomycetota bacterium]|nr:glycosyltransferase family 2 protein [Actinomycetota bacterium]
MSDPASADLAVVIVNFNTGPWLDRCLASLERHRGGVALDVLVIDNASIDDSQDAARSHPGVRLIENPTNRYLSPAWNQGARETKAPFLLFLNPDTEWWSGTLADLLAVAVGDPQAGIVGPTIRDPDGTLYASGRRFPSVVEGAGHAFVSPFTRNNPFTRRYEMEGWDRTTPRTVDWVSGACMLFPRAAFDEVGGFDEGFPLYAEELDIASRLAAAGWHVRYTPAAEVLHQVGVSTTPGGRRPHRLVVMHAHSIYRYYRIHRAAGWRRLTLPFARAALRVQAELAWAWRGVRR